MLSIVSFEKCKDYEYNKIYSVIEKQFELFNFKDKLFEGVKVVLKPNLLKAKNSKGNITTNPLIVRAVCQWLKNNGVNNITVADSPGGPYTRAALELVYGVCGYKDNGFAKYLNYNDTWQEKKTPKEFLERHYNIITPVCNADLIINLPKLKTHAMAKLSCGVKNMFGVVPGLQKPELHCKYPNEGDFTRMLTELAILCKPDITIVDAIVGMEGNGPANGIQRECGYIIASDNVFELDRAVVDFIGMPQDIVGTVAASYKYGLISDNTEIAGERENIKPFLLPQTASIDFLSSIPKPLHKLWGKITDICLKAVPKINKEKCIGCGKCEESCPQKIITVENKIAKIKISKCISCFCCHEMCPADAIIIKRNLNM